MPFKDLNASGVEPAEGDDFDKAALRRWQLDYEIALRRRLEESERQTTGEAGQHGVTAQTPSADAKAADLAPVIADVQAAGATSLRAIAADLNRRGIPTPVGANGKR